MRTKMTDLTTTASLHASPSAAIDRGELPDFLRLFAAMHDAMRRDAGRLDRAIPTLASPREAERLRAWWQRYAGVIVHHHQREDELVWPALEQRAASFVTSQAPLHDDHHALDRVMDTVDAALSTLCDDRVDFESARTAAADAAGAFRALLVDHLAREEALAFPLLAQTYTAEEYDALEQRMRKGTSLRAIGFEVAWVLDDVDPRLAALADEVLPAIMRVLLRFSWKPSYERIAAPIREVA